MDRLEVVGSGAETHEAAGSICEAKEFESKILKIEKVVPPGQTLKIRVRSLKPGTYPFVGDFHQATAKGRIIAE